MNERDIIPSHLSISETPRWSDGGAFSNMFLRFGEVQEIIYPDSEKSRSKKFVEYNVFVQHRDGGVGAGVMYTNCLLQNFLGGFADECHYTLRVPETPSIKEKDKNRLGQGSKVLLLCLNGERNNAYIIGGKRDPELDDRDKKAKDLGHHFFWVFNGINVFINKDGEFEIQYKGKTNIDGKTNDDVKDEEKGSFIQLRKNGNIILQTGDGKQVVKLDRENGKVIIARDKNLEIGDATDEMLLGKSFRDAQKQMNNKMKAKFKLLKNMLQQAGTLINTASTTPIPPGGTLGTLAPAGAMLISAANVADQIAQDIDGFEQAAGQKNSFLSKKNKAD